MNSVAQQLHRGKGRLELEACRSRFGWRRRLAHAGSTWGGAFDADVEDRRAEILRAPSVADQAVSRAVSGVHMDVDEAGRNEFAGGVDLAIEGTIVAVPDMNNPIAS